MRRALIIPAAGLGSRLRSHAPKVFTPVAGRPMLDHLLDRFRPFVHQLVVVAHPSFAGRMREHLAGCAADLGPVVVEQPAPTGMLDAILLAAPTALATNVDRVWIAWCDQVALLPETLAQLAAREQTRDPAAFIFPTVTRDEPYIHFERGTDGRISRVLQRREQDVMPPRGESDAGLFACDAASLRLLPGYAAAAATGAGTGERNFLPFISWLAQRTRIETFPCTDPREAVGVNTPGELAAVERWLEERAARS